MKTKVTFHDSDKDQEVMTLAEVAEYLKVSEKSVLRLARQGEIPVAKVASQWRFLRSALEQWLHSRMRSAADSAGGARLETGTATDRSVARLFDPTLTVLDLQPGSAEEVLQQLVEPLAKTGRAHDPAALLRLLLRRESMVSTAVGSGVAFPHVRNPEECPVTEPCIVFGRCRLGTDFGSPDGEPTRLFFLVCSRSQVLHLRALSALSSLTRSAAYRQRLEQVRDPAEFVSVIADFEKEKKAA